MISRNLHQLQESGMLYKPVNIFIDEYLTVSAMGMGGWGF